MTVLLAIPDGPKKEIKGVTFDVARTLIYIDNYQTYYRELSDYLVSQGIDLYPQELKAAREYVFMVDLPRFGLNNWYEWSKQILIRLDYPDVEDKVIEGTTGILKQSVDNYRLYDDVLPLVNHLKELPLTLSALTTIPEFKLREVLSPILSDLSYIIHGGNAKCVKGNPKMYQLDLQRKKISSSANLFIGDDHLYDIELPSRMGQTTIHIEREDNRKELEFSDYQISSLNQLIPLLESN